MAMDFGFVANSLYSFSPYFLLNVFPPHSSIGGENAFRGNVQLNASQGTATTSDRSGGTQCREEELDGKTRELA